MTILSCALIASLVGLICRCKQYYIASDCDIVSKSSLESELPCPLLFDAISSQFYTAFDDEEGIVSNDSLESHSCTESRT